MVLTFHLRRGALNLQFVYCFIIKLYPVPKGLIQSNFCEKIKAFCLRILPQGL